MRMLRLAAGMLALVILLLPAAVLLAGSVMSALELDAYYFANPDIREFRFVPARFTAEQWYAALIGNTDYTRALSNTIRFAAVTTALTLLTASPAAYALAFCRIPGKKCIAAVYLVLMLLPYQAMEMPHFFILRDLGVLGSDWSVVLTGAFDTFPVMILTAFFLTIPPESIEAAAVDGAGKLRTLISVVLPQMKHGIVTVGLLRLADAWNLTEQAILFLDDTTQYPLSVMLQTLSARHGEHAFAFAVVFVLPLVLLYHIAKDSLAETVAQAQQK